MSRVLVECYNDETLCLALNADINEVEHNIDGKGEILKKIKDRKNCTAFIDNDKGTNDEYFRKSVLKKTISDDIKVFYENVNKNHIIVFYPKLENVINRLVKGNEKNIQTAGKLGIDYNVKELHDIGRNKKKLTKLKDLFIALNSRCQEIKDIREYLYIFKK